MNLHKATQLDKTATRRFRNKEKQLLTIPASIQEEYKLNEKESELFGTGLESRSEVKTVDSAPGSPVGPYDEAAGYEFSWGHILERRVNQFILWDICLTHLLTRFHRRGLRLRDLQKVVFEAIEVEIDCAAREPVMAVGLVTGWMVYPGTAIGVFTVVVHFAAEDKARQWVIETLIEDVLPGAIATADEFATRYGH